MGNAQKLQIKLQKLQIKLHKKNEILKLPN